MRVALGPATPTSIGSLPHLDPAEAADFVLRVHPALPAAPQLPGRSPSEAMLAQAATCADLDGDGWLGVRTFLGAVAARTTPIKLQLTGPITAGLARKAQGASLHTAFRSAAAGVREQATALVALARRKAPAAPLVVFLDEPGLAGWDQPRFPLTGTQVVDLLSGALGALRPDVLTGVHCCGPTDLHLLVEAAPDVISVPVDDTLVEAASSIDVHLDRGGLVAWGAIPTDGPIGDGVDGPWRRLVEVWCALTRLGCDPLQLRLQSLVTPACGLATHRPEQAERALRLTTELAGRAHSQAVAARLSLGA